MRRLALLGTGILALTATAGCSSSNSTTTSTDVSAFQQDFSFALENNLAGFATSMKRFMLAANGTPQTGVTVTSINNGVQVSVGVDLDGDSTLETTYNATVIYINPSQGLAGGATLTLSSIAGGAPQSASGSGTITQTGPTVITVSNGQLSTTTQTQHHSLMITQANLTLDVSATLPSVTGTSHFNFDGIVGTMTFSPASATGFKVSISGNGFTTFVVPCATEIC